MSERRQRQLARKQARRDRIFLFIAALLCVFILGLFCGGRMVKASKLAKTNYKYYKVVKVDLNETLWDIAEDYMTAEYSSSDDYIAEVREINSISGDEIRYGQRLLIPYYSKEWK